MAFAIGYQMCLPRLRGFRVVRDTTKSILAASEFVAVARILFWCCFSEIGAPTVQRVCVYVVNVIAFRDGTEDERVHIDGLAIAIGRCANITAFALCTRAPSEG